MGIGDSIDFINNKIDTDKFLKQSKNILCQRCDQSCKNVQALNRLIKTQLNNSVLSDGKVKDIIKEGFDIICEAFMVNNKDADKDRRQNYNFLMSEMKNSNHTVDTIINTNYFKERMIQLKSYGWKIDDEIRDVSNSNSSSLFINFGRSGVRDNKPVFYNKYNIADDSDGESYTSDSSESGYNQGGIPMPHLRPGYKHSLSDSSNEVSELTDTETVGSFYSTAGSSSSKSSPHQIFQLEMTPRSSKRR